MSNAIYNSKSVFQAEADSDDYLKPAGSRYSGHASQEASDSAPKGYTFLIPDFFSDEPEPFSGNSDLDIQI